ncbi:hypothetical protein PROFUN_11695, partial [Planoprotostelium fungivorum]
MSKSDTEPVSLTDPGSPSTDMLIPSPLPHAFEIIPCNLTFRQHKTMNIKSALLLLTVAALAAGQIQASGNVAANTATTLPFSNTGLPIFNPLVTVLPSLNVTSSTAGKITITINTASVNTILTSAQSTGFAGGLNVDANGNLGGVFANAAFTGSLTGATNLFGSISNAL